MSYTNAEAYDMLAVYFQCFENACIAAREYAARYPERRHYGRRAFRQLAIRLRQTGSVRPISVPVRRRPIRNEDNIINVLAYVEANPNVSTMEISLDLGISRTTVFLILKDFKLHPYHVVLHQALSEDDYDRRLNYCHWLSEMCNENHQFLSLVLWTDEASFSSCGRVNLHNMHYWSQTNPHWMREVDHQNRWSVNVWCGVLEHRIIGPFIFDDHLNGESYLNFLRNDLPILLEDVPIDLRLSMWYQHDGCPAHFSQRVRDFLNVKYPNRWIGRGSLFQWPPRSPDLTVLDFYLWGRIKDIVYKIRPTTRDDMIGRITNAVNSISRAEIETAVYKSRTNINSCMLQNGGHFEHL